MSKIVVVENLSLDGVMQAPGRADEDLRDDFGHGGWALPYRDAVMGSIMGAGMAQAGPLLFGRRTYEDFFSVWPGRKDNPFTEVLDNAQKYVVSRTLTEPLPWKNSTLLKLNRAVAGDGYSDAADAVARLKEQPGKDIVVMGSGELVGSLIRHDLVDVFVLVIHPLVLGTGRRLFPDHGAFAELQLVDAKTTTTGVVIATYRQAEQTAGQND
jgi:dihydrofolate reductase